MTSVINIWMDHLHRVCCSEWFQHHSVLLGSPEFTVLMKSFSTVPRHCPGLDKSLPAAFQRKLLARTQHQNQQADWVLSVRNSTSFTPEHQHHKLLHLWWLLFTYKNSCRCLSRKTLHASSKTCKKKKKLDVSVIFTELRERNLMVLFFQTIMEYLLQTTFEDMVEPLFRTGLCGASSSIFTQGEIVTSQHLEVTKSRHAKLGPILSPPTDVSQVSQAV